MTKKLELRETSFSYLITCSNALNNLFNICPCLIEEYIFTKNPLTNKTRVELYLEVIKSLYFNILLYYFNYCQISIYFKNFSELFKSRLVYLFMEQLLVEKSLEYNYEIFDDSRKKIILKNKVPEEYVKYIEKYVKENSIVRNEVNNRDYIVAEIFENLGLMINMIQNYIELLGNMFTKYQVYFTNEKRTENELKIFGEYKKKTSELIFLNILNIHTSSIIKQCSKFLCLVFRGDEKLKEEIFKSNIDKINALINKIGLEEIRESNCAINQDGVIKLQKEELLALYIINKSMNLNNLNEGMKKILVQNIKHFDTISEEKLENSQIVLLYGYISIFLYLDISNDKDLVYNIFKLILNTFKESLKYPSKNLLNFHKTKFVGNVMKLISKYRKYFSRYLIDNSENKNNSKYAFELIKIILTQEKNYLIR